MRGPLNVKYIICV